MKKILAKLHETKILEGSVAATIRNQIGRMALMRSGARDFMSDKNALIFRINVDKDGFMAAAKGRYFVRITLTSMDDYTIQFYKARGTKIRDIKTVNGIYADQLGGLVEEIGLGRWGN